MLLRHADVRALLADRRVISNALALITRLVEEGPLVDWWRGMLTNLNGPEHDRLRRLVARAFTPRSVDRERPRIRRLTREILARHADAGEIDLFHSWADELPIRLICGLLGFDQAHHDDLARWSTDLGQVISAVMALASSPKPWPSVAGRHGTICSAHSSVPPTSSTSPSVREIW
jgi:cytochrome P450